jgi:hypothetical protein
VKTPTILPPTHDVQVWVTEQVYPVRGVKEYRAKCCCGYESKPTRDENEADLAVASHKERP